MYGAIRACLVYNKIVVSRIWFFKLLTGIASYTSQSFHSWATIVSYKKPNAGALFLYTKSTHVQSIYTGFIAYVRE